MRNIKAAIYPIAVGFSFVAMAAQAQESAPPSLSLDLNAVEQVDANCRLIFVAENKLGGDIDALSVETVLFDGTGKVDRFTLFDFKSMPEGKTRVRQFELADTDCANVARVLINGVATCEGEGFEGSECSEGLSVKSSTDTEISG